MVLDHCVTTLVWYLIIICHCVCLTPDYGLLPRAFGPWLRCVTTFVWYLTTVCFHVRLVPDYTVLPRQFGTWLLCVVEGMGVTSAWSPLGNFVEGQAHPNVFAFLQFSSNLGFSIFCVVKFLSHVFSVFAFRWFTFIFISFLNIFSLYSGFFDLCWVISLGCRPRIECPAHTLYIYGIV